MEKLTIRTLLLAAAVVTPSLASPTWDQVPIKRAETLSNEELRQTLRAKNCAVFKELVDHQSEEPA